MACSVSCPKNGDVPKSPLPPNWQHGAIGRHNKTSNCLRSARCYQHPYLYVRELLAARVPIIERRQT